MIEDGAVLGLEDDFSLPRYVDMSTVLVIEGDAVSRLEGKL